MNYGFDASSICDNGQSRPHKTSINNPLFVRHDSRLVDSKLCRRTFEESEEKQFNRKKAENYAGIEQAQRRDVREGKKGEIESRKVESRVGEKERR